MIPYKTNWNISLNYSCDLLLSSFLSTKLYPSSDCVLSSVPLNLAFSLSSNCFNKSWHWGSWLVLLKQDCLQMSSQHLTTYMKVHFFITKDEEENEDVTMQGQLCLKDWKIVIKAKKFTNLMSGRLWTTQADINWYIYACLAAAAITSLFNSILTAFKSKFLVKLLSYLKQFWWFHSSAIFFLQQSYSLYKLKLQKH